MMLTIDEIAQHYKLPRANVLLRMARVSDFGGRYDEATVKPIMEAPKDEEDDGEDMDEFYRWLHDEVRF